MKGNTQYDSIKISSVHMTRELKDLYKEVISGY